MSKAAVIKGNKLVATADTVAEAEAYAKKVGGLALVPATRARKNGAKAKPKPRPKWVNEAFEDVRIRWSGAGHYWMTGPRGSGELDLGKCRTETQLRKTVRDAIQIGTGDDDWSGWTAAK